MTTTEQPTLEGLAAQLAALEDPFNRLQAQLTAIHDRSGDSIALPLTLPASALTTTAPGYAPSVIYLDSTPEFYGAKRDGVTNDTEAFQRLNNALEPLAGEARLSSGTYIVDGLLCGYGVKWMGRGGGNVGTTLKAVAGSEAPGLLMKKPGVLRYGVWKGIRFASANNVEQDAIYFDAQEAGGQGGCWNSLIEDCEFGTPGAPWHRNSIWFRGGALNFKAPHQFIDIKNCTFHRGSNTEQGETSRTIKASGQCAKISTDKRCTVQGFEGAKFGVNVELTPEYMLATTATAEAAVKATKITVASTAGFENKKVFSIGEGRRSEVCTVESIAGLEITLAKELQFTHAAGSRLYLLAGTVGAPSTNAPVEITIDGGALQNADLQIFARGEVLANVFGTDFEEQHAVLRACEGAIVNITTSARPITVSEGTINGQGKITAGSGVITGATKAWNPGEKINSIGAGIPYGAEVEKYEAGTITLAGGVVCEAPGNGTGLINLTKGGNGEGYIANYETGASGELNITAIGTIDRYVIGNNTGLTRIANMQLPSGITTFTSTGVTYSHGTQGTLTTGFATEAVITNATVPITAINSQLPTGAILVLRATTAKTKLESTGNMYLAGKASLEWGVGECVLLKRTDYGPYTWVLLFPLPPNVGTPGAYEAREANKEFAVLEETTTVYLTIKGKAEKTGFEVLVEGKPIYKMPEEALAAAAVDETFMFRVKAAGKWEVKVNTGTLAELHSVYQAG